MSWIRDYQNITIKWVNKSNFDYDSTPTGPVQVFFRYLEQN